MDGWLYNLYNFDSVKGRFFFSQDAAFAESGVSSINLSDSVIVDPDVFGNNSFGGKNIKSGVTS